MSSDNNDDQSQNGSLAPVIAGGLLMYWMFGGGSGGALPKAGGARPSAPRPSRSVVPTTDDGGVPSYLPSSRAGPPFDVTDIPAITVRRAVRSDLGQALGARNAAFAAPRVAGGREQRRAVLAQLDERINEAMDQARSLAANVSSKNEAIGSVIAAGGREQGHAVAYARVGEGVTSMPRSALSAGSSRVANVETTIVRQRASSGTLEHAAQGALELVDREVILTL